MSVAIGLGLMDFPFAGAGDYWRWVDLCEQGGVDSKAVQQECCVKLDIGLETAARLVLV